MELLQNVWHHAFFETQCTSLTFSCTASSQRELTSLDPPQIFKNRARHSDSTPTQYHRRDHSCEVKTLLRKDRVVLLQNKYNVTGKNVSDSTSDNRDSVKVHCDVHLTDKNEEFVRDNDNTQSDGSSTPSIDKLPPEKCIFRKCCRWPWPLNPRPW